MFARCTASGGSVLILAGRTSFGTHGVGEFFSDPARMEPLFQKMRAAAGKRSLPGSFVILLRIEVSGNIPVGVSFVKLHVEPGS